MQIFLLIFAVGIGCFVVGIFAGMAVVARKLKLHEKIKSRGKEVDIDEEDDE